MQKILSGSLNNNLTWHRNENTLYIEGTGEMEPLDPCDDFPLSDCWKNIQTVVIREGITFIDFSAFDSSLTSIRIPASISYIDPYHLSYCHNLQQISVSEENQQYSSVDGILFSKDGHEIVFMPPKHSSFYSIPETVTSIGAYAFSGCIGLTEITISEGVISIGDCAFEDCTGLTRIILPESVGFIGEDAFARCTGLTEITILSGITSISCFSFAHCTGLAKIILPESIVSIAEYAFLGCASLTSINLPTSIISIGNRAFEDCTSLKNILFPNTLTSIGNSAFKDCTSLKNILFPNTLTSIGECAFQGCFELTEIIIPSSVTDLGYGAFQYCYGLDKVIIQEGCAFRDNAFPKMVDVYFKDDDGEHLCERYDEDDDAWDYDYAVPSLPKEIPSPKQIPSNCAQVDSLRSDLVIVKSNEKWGAIDRMGNVVIPLEWDAISSFHRMPFHHRSYAAVIKNGLTGLIDDQGNLLIPCRWKAIGYHYDYDWIVVCDDISENYYNWRWWHYDLETGQTLEWMYNGDDLRGEYDAIEPFLITN